MSARSLSDQSKHTNASAFFAILVPLFSRTVRFSEALGYILPILSALCNFRAMENRLSSVFSCYVGGEELVPYQDVNIVGVRAKPNIHASLYYVTCYIIFSTIVQMSAIHMRLPFET